MSRLSAGLARAIREAATVNAGEAALEVHRAAAPDVAAADEPGERVDRPQVALDAHDVLVTGEQQRLGGRVGGAQAGDEVRLAGRRRGHDLGLEPERREPRPQQLGDLLLVARRVGGVGADQLLQQVDDLAVRPVVLRARRRRSDRPAPSAPPPPRPSAPPSCPRPTRRVYAPDMSDITEHEAAEVARANESGLQPVVFVHGLWLLPSSWDRWAEVFAGGRAHAADARLARRPRDGRGGQRRSRRLRGQERRPGRRPLRGGDPHARPQAGGRSATRSAAC